MLKNKRGIELMGKTIIEILVAIIIVGLLLYAGYVLFRVYFGSQREDQASGQLDTIINKINELETLEEVEIFVIAPTEWYLVSFDKNNIFVDSFEKPVLMRESNCLCICKDKKCNICQSIEMPIKKDDALFSIKIPQEIIILKGEEEFELRLKQQ